MECVHLGEHCDIKTLVQASTDGQMTPSCQFSKFDMSGERRMKRNYAISGLLGITSIDPYFSRVETSNELQQVAYDYFPPSDTDYSNA